MSAIGGCQEVISTPSAVCKQTFLIHAMSYFGDQFCTLRELYLITCLIYQARHCTSTNHGQNQASTCAEVGALNTIESYFKVHSFTTNHHFHWVLLKGHWF